MNNAMILANSRLVYYFIHKLSLNNIYPPIVTYAFSMSNHFSESTDYDSNELPLQIQGH